MSTPHTETAAPFRVSQRRELTMPLSLLAALVAACAVGYAALTGTQEQVRRNTTDIVDVKRDAQVTREILIRIDENVKQLKEARK